jgi:hypothetical protein
MTVFAAAIGGLGTDYFAGVTPGCNVLHPGSSLCGLDSVRIGAVCGWRRVRKAS